MPIYEYQCSACNHKFEVIRKVSDELLTLCPQCNKHALRKLVTAAAFRLKGSGWYETDFKDKKPGKSPESGGRPETGTESGKTGTADSGADGKEAKTTASEQKPAGVKPGPARTATAGKSSTD